MKDFSKTIWLDAKEKRTLLKFIKGFGTSAISYMESLGFEKSELFIEFFLDMRYKGQGFELTIPYSTDYVSSFEAEHEKQFGYRIKAFPIEIVTLRVRIKGSPLEKTWKIEKENSKIFHFKTRVFTENGWIEVPVIDWNSLTIGENFRGPALIVENFTTVWVEKDFKVKVEKDYTLILKKYESDRVGDF